MYYINVRDKRKGEKRMKKSNIYTIQSYIDEAIVEEKRINEDYVVNVSEFDDDGETVLIIVDGHHSLEAANRDNVDPVFNLVENQNGLNLENFVIAFNDLSNPVNIETGIELW